MYPCGPDLHLMVISQGSNTVDYFSSCNITMVFKTRNPIWLYAKEGMSLVGVSLAVINCLVQKQLEEGSIYFIYSSALKSVKAGMWRQELKQEL